MNTADIFLLTSFRYFRSPPDISSLRGGCCEASPSALFLKICLVTSQGALYSLRSPSVHLSHRENLTWWLPLDPESPPEQSSHPGQAAAVLSSILPQLPGTFCLPSTLPTRFQSNFWNVQTSAVTRRSYGALRKSIKWISYRRKYLVVHTEAANLFFTVFPFNCRAFVKCCCRPMFFFLHAIFTGTQWTPFN